MRIGVFVEGVPVAFRLGSAYYTVIAAGALNALGAFAIIVFFPTLSTFLELDYDTPWENKQLKEYSKSRRKKKTTTNFYVDARLRGSMRRFRESILKMRRSKSHDPSVGLEMSSSPSSTLELPPAGKTTLVHYRHVDVIADI